MSVVAIVPAAGKGERFGGSKLVVDINGEPMIDWTLWSLMDGGVDRIVVVTALDTDLSVSRRISDPRVLCVVNEDPSRGMFSSVQTGLAIASGDPVLFMPADMPFVASGTVTEVITTCIRRQRVVVPTFEGTRGHPIAMPGALRRAIVEAPADSTLKDALGAAGATRIELPVSDPGILRDVDRPEDLA